MIKASSEKTLFLGLSHINLERLRSGYPIDFNAREFGVSKDICIISLKTEEDILKAMIFAGLIDPQMAANALKEEQMRREKMTDPMRGH